MVSNGPRNWSESTKTASVDNRHVRAPGGPLIVEITPGPKTVSNSRQNGPESAETASVDDRHVNGPRGLLIVEITSGPQNSE